MQRKIFAIENTVGKMVDPVAEDDHTGTSGSAERVIDQHMAMAENEVVDRARMLGEILAAVGDERLLLAEKLRAVVGEVARMARPPVGEGDSPAGMDGGIEPLGKTAAEGGADGAEQRWQLAQAVAVAEEEMLPLDGEELVAVDHRHPYLIAEIVEEPDVVVADEPCDLHPAVG